VARLRDAPSRWLFAGARVSAPSATKLVVRVPFAWRRFPYALTAVAAAPRFVPGPFRLVSGTARRVVVRNSSLTVSFRRSTARAAARAFERGELDEAPVPVGEIAATRARLRGVVRARTLLALDGVLFRRLRPALRRAYADTANRNDYAELVSESRGAAADAVKPREFRRAVAAIRHTLQRVIVRIGVPSDPALRYGARLLYGQWRDVGLGPQLVSEPGRALDGSFARTFAPYPQEEALPAQLAFADGVGSRTLLLRALAADQQQSDLARFNADLRASARFVPIAWVVDARLVSPRLAGWREDALGDVDYGAVRSRASSRRR
jgi:hypothetical protein